MDPFMRYPGQVLKTCIPISSSMSLGRGMKASRNSRLYRCSGRQFPKNADMKFFMPLCYLREHRCRIDRAVFVSGENLHCLNRH
jgi:hypothetical protein